ncbi:haloacid dehalogenase type II [Pelagibacterium sp.]|uniref:haloacid dehalogenase type II n=1 Tax=Pelagibacterium sp. TaxID=1967288 RepID=UPI003BAB9FCE
MTDFRPKYITFDCYGTLTRFRMSDMTDQVFGDRVKPDDMPTFKRDFQYYRLDEVLGAWKPYSEVLSNAVERTCRRWGIQFRPEDGKVYYNAVPTWGPWPDVTEGLVKIADKIPLVILSNASNDQIHANVEKLGAPFHKVFTAQDAQAYKPRLRAFEYMLDQLGADPSEILHVSSSNRYDIMSVHDLRFGGRCFVARGHEPFNSYYATVQIKDISELPGVVGL